MKSKIVINLIFFAFIGVLLFSLATPPTHAAAPSIIVRDDGLTVVTPQQPDPGNKEQVQYLTMIVKTGYGNDPADKAGLTSLTNNLMFILFKYYSHAADVDCQTNGDYTIYHFTVMPKDLKLFCADLDEFLRTEVLFGYDFCNAWIEYMKNAPRHPGLPSLINLAGMLYGPDHSYTKFYNPNYANLNVGELNKWFRKIYRPNNLIVSSTFSLPDEFLRRPSGKEFKEPVGLPKIAPPVFDAAPAIKYVPDHDYTSVVSMGFPAPQLSDDSYLSIQLGWLYLDYELNEELREKSGYVYYVAPNCTAGDEPSAPAFIILFQSLPEDTGVATQKVIDVLKSLAKDGIPADKLAKIMESEKKRLALRDKSPADLTNSYAFRALFNVKWFGDSDEYLNQLEKSSKNVAKVFADRLPGLKISIAGPEGVEPTLKAISLDDLTPQKP